ncbi:hypothetical protein BK673_16215 [Pseudomonas fluorescens]|uniref:Uncharacterized protein n=1 Tax=Pseudomonas fluorescens TaxID=294 RepID=A0A423P4D3_PSEFL|nr:hypothetical protein [Pseudomonas fluorescens]ROO08084.1 hypothetical protein BK673_16215 [Pseudomonas fluorescens]
MQQSDAKQKPKYKLLRTIGAWALVPGLGVPATKFVESYYDVSVFSSLWNWIRSVGNWLAKDVSLPLWVMFVLSLMSALLVLLVGLLVYVRFEKQETPADLESTGAPLSDDQNLVFLVVGNAIQQGYQFGFDDVLGSSGLSRIATQNALDHLANVGLIRPVRSSYGGNYADLTPMGRDHFLELEALSKG